MEMETGVERKVIKSVRYLYTSKPSYILYRKSSRGESAAFPIYKRGIKK